MSAGHPGERGGEQLALDVGITGRAPVRNEAWWVAAVEDEAEGDQDAGWWGA